MEIVKETLAEEAAPAEAAAPAPVTSKNFWPGHMKFVSERGGHTAGCAVKTFVPKVAHGEFLPADDQLNDWAEVNPSLLVVAMHVTPCPVENVNPDADDSFMAPSITIVYTKTMTPEEIEEYDDLARSWAEVTEKRKREWEAAKDAAEKAQRDAEKEVRDLVEAGKTCRAHHASLVEENRKLKKGKGK